MIANPTDTVPMPSEPGPLLRRLSRNISRLLRTKTDNSPWWTSSGTTLLPAMACCYIAAFCISQLVNACQFLDLDNSIRYNDDKIDDLQEKPKPFQDRETGTKSIVLSLSGMTCSACSNSIESALNSLPDVDKARVSLPLQQATVIGKGPVLDRETIKNAVLDLGYGAELGPRSPKEIIDILRAKEEIVCLKSSFSKLAQCATIIQLVSLLLSKFGRDRLPSFILSLVHLSCASLVLFAQFHYIAWIHIDGWKGIRGGRPNMNTLISSSVSLGTAFSFLDLLIRGPAKATPYYSTVIGLALVVVAGRYLETMSRRPAAEHLIRVYRPLLEDQHAMIYSTGQLVPQSFLRPGDEIVIESFSTIPCDCYITLGSSSINQAIVTGESMPVKKEVGDFLLGGTRNMGNQLVCVVHKERGSSFYAQLVQSAVEASGSKSEDFQLLDMLMNYFVIIFMSLAVLIPLKDIYWSANPLNYTAVRSAMMRCMTILTCACPCALGLAIPSAVVAAANVASERGVVITKGFSTIKKLCSAQTIVFDKTGTLTRATLDVSSFQTAKRWAQHTTDFWTYICAVEEHTISTHPLGRTIFSAGATHLDDPWGEAKANLRTEGVEIEPGMGISGDVSIGSQPWQHVTIGSWRYLKSCGILGLPDVPRESDGGVIAVYIGIEYAYAGTLSITDIVRDDAKATIHSLRLMGCETKLLTGDMSHSAQRVSRELHIPILASEATPQDKLDLIKRVQGDGRVVSMVGDGLNDAPSLSAADVGIALYHEAATPTVGASVIILNSRLDSIPLLLRIAKHTVQQIRYSLAWVLSYNCLALSMAAGFITPFGVVLTPPLAAALMSTSSILITLNSLWLRSRLAALDS